jgi:hypothetical protein
MSTVSYAQSWQWARGRSCGDHHSGDVFPCIKTDRFENVYIGGYSGGDSICIDSYKFYNYTQLVDTVYSDDLAVIAKYNSSGAVLWATANTWGDCVLNDIAVDAQGNVYELGGLVTDSARFGPYSIVNKAYDSILDLDVPYFLVKYSSDGNVQWVKTGGFISINGDLPAHMRIDEAGNVYIVSSFLTSLTNIGDDTLINHSPGYPCAFVAKFDSSGNVIWAKSLGNINVGYSMDVAVGGDNNLYVTGGLDPFLIKLDTAGNTIWTKTNTGDGIPECITIDKMNNIYVGGFAWLTHTDTLSFGSFKFAPLSIDPSVIVGFLVKYDQDGNVLDAKCLSPDPSIPISYTSTDPFIAVSGMTTDSCDNVWINGSLLNEGGIQLDSAVTLFAPLGSHDPMFFAEFDSYGQLLDYSVFSSGVLGDCAGIVSGGQNIYFCGEYTVDPFVLGRDTLRADATSNFYIAKYSPNNYCDLGKSIV